MIIRSLTLRLCISILILFLSVSVLSLTPGQVGVRGQAPARLEVWSPDVHSSNITSLTLFPVGSTFTVLVNLTYPGKILTFDISLDYNITVGPNVLQAVSASLAGGLIDPNGPPPGPGCSAGPLALDVDGGGARPGRIHVGAQLVGGCPITGTGILFTLVFKVTGIGAGSIDIDDGTGNGSFGSQISGLDSDGNVILVSHDSFSAYFRNKTGIPPVPTFAFKPSDPVLGTRVTFNATGSYDPENQNAPDHGIAAEPVVYDSNGNQVFDGPDTVLLGPTPAAGTVLKGDPDLLFIDSNGNHKWDPGETVLYDSTGALTFRATDVVISGAVPTLGTILASDPNIRYVMLHPNNIWDNGYVWDFGDGTSIVPGIVSSHIFTAAGSLPARGTFEVRLVVYDRDDSLPMRQLTPVTVGFGIRHDVVLILTLSSPSINVGDPLNVTIRLTNVGNKDETVNVNANYTLHGGTTIATESGIVMPVSGSQVSRQYPLQTGSLAPGSYVVTSQATLVNATTGAIIPYTNPSDSFARANFIVRSPQPPSVLSLPLVAAGGVAAVAIVSSAVYLLRRRRKEET